MARYLRRIKILCKSIRFSLGSVPRSDLVIMYSEPLLTGLFPRSFVYEPFIIYVQFEFIRFFTHFLLKGFGFRLALMSTVVMTTKAKSVITFMDNCSVVLKLADRFADRCNCFILQNGVRTPRYFQTLAGTQGLSLGHYFSMGSWQQSVIDELGITYESITVAGSLRNYLVARRGIDLSFIQHDRDKTSIGYLSQSNGLDSEVFWLSNARILEMISALKCSYPEMSVEVFGRYFQRRLVDTELKFLEKYANFEYKFNESQNDLDPLSLFARVSKSNASVIITHSSNAGFELASLGVRVLFVEPLGPEYQLLGFMEGSPLYINSSSQNLFREKVRWLASLDHRSWSKIHTEFAAKFCKANHIHGVEFTELFDRVGLIGGEHIFYE